jgi:hypothetical protein
MNKALKKAAKNYKEKVVQTVTITFEEGQIPVLVRALEAFTRFRSGQITMALDEVYADKQTEAFLGKDYNHIDDNRDIENLIRKVYFKDLKHANEAFGVGGLGYGGDEAYTISKTLRQYLAYKRNDGYDGFGVDFNGVIGKYGEYSVPTIQGFTTEKFFPFPKKHQEKAFEFFTNEDYKSIWEMGKKYMKKLPRGEQYRIGCNFDVVGFYVDKPQKDATINWGE